MTYPWDHGKISREACERLLVESSTNGAFLVRESESVSDAHVLSIWSGNMVHHFRVLKKDDKFTIPTAVGGYQRVFSHLWEIIEHFKQPDQGLPCALTDPIVKEWTNDQLEHDSDDDEQVDNNIPVDVVDGDTAAVNSIFLTKIPEMDTSRLDDEFLKDVHNYLNSGLAQDGTRLNTSAPATDLQELIVKSAAGVSRELKEFLKKIVFLQELFSPEKDADKLKCVSPASNSSSARSEANNVVAYDDLVDDFAKSVAGVKSLLMLVQKVHQDHNSFMKTQQSQTRTFEVNTCGNFKTKAFLKVDITEGKLWFMKNESDSIEDCSVVDHDKILQLVKDPDTPKLTFKTDSKSNREYVFKDVQARENLCQLAQYMMNFHTPNRKEPKEILIFVGTWNMGYAAPENIDSWLNCVGTGKMNEKENEVIEVVGHDIYAIGTQEGSNIGENTWIAKLKVSLKRKFKVEYYTVAVHSLWGIRLVILAKPEHKNRISRVEKSSVKTGIANKLGNKGGVGISFDFLSTSLCFINCHLTSGSESVRKGRRAQNYLAILKGLNLGHKSTYDLTNQFHHVFWFGDLNYRIDLDNQSILGFIQNTNYSELKDEDQLTKEQSSGQVFFEFYEAELYFPPTYRYKRGTRDTYDYVKVKRTGNRYNVPSWCDRVLWKSFPELPIKQISYGCTKDIVTSDHSPVFSSFEVPITSQFVASQDQATMESQTNKSPCKLFFQDVRAKLETVSSTEFSLEFQSVCIGASQKSKAGKPGTPWDPPCNTTSNPVMYRYIEWDALVMPELNPIVDDREYLKGQHLLISVKSKEDESYGECVLSLKSHIFDLPQPFRANLTHGGKKTGEITGNMKIHYPGLARKQSEADSRKHAPSSPCQSRPYSYIGPSTAVATTSLPNRARSLGRDQRLPQYNTVRVQQPDVSIPNSFTIKPEVPKRTKRNIPGNQTTESEPRIPPIPERTQGNQTTKRKLPFPPLPERTEGNQTTGSEPPALPEKHGKALPTSVVELLWKLELIDYISNLEENGFDDIIFLEGMNEKDLVNAGITNGEHRKQILNEVQRLKRAGFFNS